MRLILAVLAPFYLVFVISPVCHSYDADTHFYMTYTMARYVGLKHEVASRIALGGEWGDEHLMTSPMGPLVIGTKLRKPHFPGYVKASKMSSYQYLGIDITKTKEMHDFATEMFTEGLKEGSLFKAVQSFHTMQDSFSHHGTPEILGHSYGGHWPDRPYWRNYDWYKNMVKANIEMMWALRELLPIEARDTELRPSPNSPLRNYQMSSVDLAESFTNLPLVHYVATRDILTDPEYVEFAVRNLIATAIKDGYLNNKEDIQGWVNSERFDLGETAQTVLERLVLRMVIWEKEINHDTDTTDKCLAGRRIINREFISKDIGIYLCDPIWIREHGGSKKVITELVEVLTQGYVPVSPSPYTSLIEVELEGPIREKEMEIRIRQIKNLIWNLYGLNIDFKPNQSTFKQVQSILDSHDLPSKETFGTVTYNAKTGTSEITISDEDQDRYCQMIKTYLFPNMNAQKTWKEKVGRFLAYFGGPITALYYWDYNFWDKFAKLTADIFDNRIVAGPENTYYRNVDTFNAYKGNKFKYLLSPQTIKDWSQTAGSEHRRGGSLYSENLD